MFLTRFAAGSLVLMACVTATTPAKLLEVTHSPVTGQYASVTAALIDAGDGDTIEIIDNSAPFVESLNINNKPNLTLEGRADLNPRPTIRGVAGVHPIEPGTYPNGATLILTGNTMTPTIRNLIVDGAATNNAVETRFVTPVLIENVKISLGTTTASLKKGLFAANDIAVRSCEIDGDGTGIEHWFGGSVTIENTRVVVSRSITSADQGIALYMHGGTLTANQCFFETLTPEQAIRFQFADEITNGDSINLISNSIITSGYTGTDGTLLVTCRQHTNKTKLREITFDNCDFVGSSTNTPTTTFHAFGTEYALDHVHFVDSILYNIQNNFFANYANVAADVVNVDYCVFKQVIHDPAQGAFTPGTHNLSLAAADPLYVNAVAGNLHLLAQSSALTLNSTGTPVYAGSQGPIPPVTAAKHWTLY